MCLESIKFLFARDLLKLKAEIESFNVEDNIWETDFNINNSAGNLCLHIIGNLKTYIGHNLGNIAYQREREKEFSLKGISKLELVEKILETETIIRKSLNKLDSKKIKEDFPYLIWEKPETIEYTLLHLLGHLNYHLGQISYQRRVFDI